MTSHKLFPRATLVVPESEAADYAHIGLRDRDDPGRDRRHQRRAQLDPAPLQRGRHRHARRRHHRLRLHGEPALPEALARRNPRHDRERGWCARGAGARLFGWHQRSDPRLLQRNDPFGVNHWVGGAVGVVRDEDGGVPKWDELLKCKCDIDATLQELLDNRLVWNEARFCFVQERDKNLGGNTPVPQRGTHRHREAPPQAQVEGPHPLRELQEPGPRRHGRPAPADR